jgi:hypothetical protein
MLVKELHTKGGRHLVIVRYSPGHSCHEEWVYNDADIASAPIVWARDSGPEWRQRLIAEFKGRTVWVLPADELKGKQPTFNPPPSTPAAPATKSP